MYAGNAIHPALRWEWSGLRDYHASEDSACTTFDVNYHRGIYVFITKTVLDCSPPPRPTLGIVKLLRNMRT